MKHFKSEILANAPVAESARLIDFESAQVNGGFINETYFLTVTGEKPYLNMEVRLSPVIYTHQPEYWRIDVIGLLPGFGLPAFGPYTETIEVTSFIGTKGIEVFGATKSEKIDIFDSADNLCNENGDVRYRADQVPGGVIIFADGEHPTSGYEAFFTQSPIDVFPPQFILNHRKVGDTVLDVIIPFNIWVSFAASEKIETVIVHDAQGAHEIAVEQVPD